MIFLTRIAIISEWNEVTHIYISRGKIVKIGRINIRFLKELNSRFAQISRPGFLGRFSSRLNIFCIFSKFATIDIKSIYEGKQKLYYKNQDIPRRLCSRFRSNQSLPRVKRCNRTPFSEHKCQHILCLSIKTFSGFLGAGFTLNNYTLGFYCIFKP